MKKKKVAEKKESAVVHPKRVPIDPIPFMTWKIKKLPPDLKNELDRMFSEGTLHSCRQLAKWLGDNGFEISHAAIHKWGRSSSENLPRSGWRRSRRGLFASNTKLMTRECRTRC